MPISAAPTVPATKAYTLQDWQGGHESLKQEYDYWIDDIEGVIPPDLQGTLFRNGPGLLDIAGDPLQHPFDGDGMICAITFDQGRVHFRNRFVRTAGYVAEQAAGKILYRGVFGTQKPGGWLANVFDLRLKNIANTSVLYWGGKLMALWEADQPYRLRPHDLSTVGLEDLGGLLKSGQAFSAHPRVLPARDSSGRRLVNFSMKAGPSTKLSIYEFDESGRLLQERCQSLPGFAFIHDFVVTANYYVFFQNPMSFNPLPFVFGLKGPGECLKFEAHKPTKIWLIPREPNQPVQQFETDSCFVFHHANAYEQDQQVVIDSVCYPSFPALEAEQDFRQVDFDQIPGGQLWRFTLDISPAQGATVKPQTIATHTCEFPTLNPQQAGQGYRYLYIGATHQTTGNAPLQALLKFDLSTGDRQQWSAAPHGFMGEPIFVPKPNAEREDQGWLLALVYDASEHRSQIVILNAEDITAGPMARLKLQHHVPYGLHGYFVPQVFTPADQESL